MKKAPIIFGIILLVLIIFIVWRFIRPMNIFIVDEQFAWPIDTTQAPSVLGNLSAKECANCHQDFYDEWQTTIHSQAWTDPYYQTDWQFENSQFVCRLCHTPLDRQLPQKILGYRDEDKWDPILQDNPDFDAGLQHEGVTCAACHYQDGKIVGVLGNTNAPHPVSKLDDPNQICVRCHLVEGDRWDTFFRFPPCGTVAEIKSSRTKIPDTDDLQLLSRLQALDASTEKDKESNAKGKTREHVISNKSSLGCVQCHMPLVKRPLVEGGEVRHTRSHVWRGGHNSDMVKKALSVEFVEKIQPGKDSRHFQLTLANTGAAHYVPTGTPDRHLTVHLRLLDQHGQVLEEKNHTLKRTIMWRPFIVDLWDTRLPRQTPRQYDLYVPGDSKAVGVEAEIRYHLLEEKRRQRIGYKNKTPIDYEVFRKKIILKQDTKGS